MPHPGTHFTDTAPTPSRSLQTNDSVTMSLQCYCIASPPVCGVWEALQLPKRQLVRAHAASHWRLVVQRWTMGPWNTPRVGFSTLCAPFPCPCLCFLKWHSSGKAWDELSHSSLLHYEGSMEFRPGMICHLHTAFGSVSEECFLDCANGLLLYTPCEDRTEAPRTSHV